MCGIVGYVSRAHDIEDEHVIARMTKMIEHRGPDDFGYHVLDVFGRPQDTAIGFARLSILDVSAKGHQPMFNDAGTVSITFNGEIYNAFDYREELLRDGFTFHSHTDTEILLHLYEKYGIEGMLERANGMFALCITDARKHRIYFARDRMGVKPLYFYQNPQVFLWSSECKTFFAHPAFQNALNEDALGELFFFRYVAGRETLLKGVENVLPGHYLELSETEVLDHCYWDLPEKGDGQAHLEEYDARLRAVVSARLLSDVPLGVQLSGGVDSSLVLAYATEAGGDMGSYSIDFEDPAFSEKPWIEIAAEKYRAKQHVYRFQSENFVELFEKSTWHLDTPLNHPNSLGIYWLCKHARPHVKVLLTGEGADELFGGYPRYGRSIWSVEYADLARQEDCERGITRYWQEDPVSKFIASAAIPTVLDFERLLPSLSIEQAMNRRRRIYRATPGEDGTVQACLNYELKTYLVDILNRQDKMSMAASMETRVPFLDYHLVEFVRRQDPHTYLRAVRNPTIRDSKIPLKELAAQKFGESFAYRQKKGFPMPLHDIFYSKEFTQLAEEDLLPRLQTCGILQVHELQLLWKHRRYLTTSYLNGLLWTALAFSEWSKIFLGEKRHVIEAAG